ncbi:MAG: hypothetical protein KAT17_05955 [Candidatus Aminicenantes bacterium]|nr:hypothetical protein [Candidatus Aminicenantes bacterium]
MKLSVLILNKEEYLETLLEGYVEIGITEEKVERAFFFLPALKISN